MFAQVYNEEHQFCIDNQITYHLKDRSDIPILEVICYFANGQQNLKNTTMVWKVIVQFNDVILKWNNMNYLKGSNPIQVAEYEV